MENAAQALRLAAWVLIFVTALSIIMNAFSLAKTSIDSVLTTADREYITTYIPASGDTEREVRLESIIPVLYRSFKENYKIVFSDYVLYKIGDTEIDYIDLSINGLQDSAKEEFIKRILYGENYSFKNESISFPNIKFEAKLKGGNYISGGLYELIKNQTFKESVGLYYEQETEGASDIPEANKTEKRVITYTKI